LASGDAGKRCSPGNGAVHEPVDVARDEDPAVLDAAVAFVEVEVAVDRLGGASAKKRSTSSRKLGWLP